MCSISQGGCETQLLPHVTRGCSVYASRTLSIDMQWHSSGWSVTKLEMLEGILDGAVYVPWSSQGYSWGKHHSMKWSSADHDLASTIQWFELWRDELKLPGRPPARRTFSGTTESALSTSLKVHDH
ncbi:hypothetical protein AV530_004306 [Patagioenas fasciata monilis]|uniref:Uncharacterized protein n=1 Tax=Patagioenas fasciata monilis TaxID=372326 RepID=A0A1V4KAK2_PATFA|nr:hypothetical protein AV530_004306 [Patagioenas fasciata monilis]